MPFGFGRGRGRGGGRHFRGGRRRGWFGPSWGPGGAPDNCICPNCGTVVSHRKGLPCFQTMCPKCGTSMMRQFPSE